MNRREAGKVEEPVTDKSSMPTIPRWMKVTLSTALLVLLVAGAWFYHDQERRYRRLAADDLSEIVRLKADQITAWRNERQGDAAVLMDSLFFIRGAERFMADPRGENAKELRSRLSSVSTHYHYADILLTGPDGTCRFSLGGPLKIDIDERKALTAALRDRKPVFTEMHLSAQNPKARISVVAPLFTGWGDNRRAVGAIILICDASQYLFPLIQDWPTASTSAETLLVTRDGDYALFLNELRQRRDTAVRMRIPLSRTDVPAVMAVQGRTGITTGRDYRGVEVLAAIQPVPDSSWFVVAKVDLAEIYAEWRFLSILIFSLFLSVGICMMIMFVMAWHRNEKAFYKSKYIEEARLLAEVQKARDYAERILEFSPGPLLVLDAELKVLKANRSFLEFFITTVDETSGRFIYDLGDRQWDIPELRTLLEEVSARDTRLAEYEVELAFPVIGHKIMIINATRVYDEGLGTDLILLGIEDITRQKKAEEELRRINEELERRVDERTALLKRRTEELELANERLMEVDRAKSAFLASMSHELRTPLNSIIGFSSILHDEWVGTMNAEQKENLATILHSGRHLLNMINDILDVTQIEAGTVTPVIEEFELHDLLAEAESRPETAIREKGLELRSESLRRRMRTDRRRLLQCVSNLLGNAAKFTDRGSVTVAARLVSGETPEAEMVEISVTDTGIGIREEDLPRIFEPFHRVVTPQREVVPGTGIGLFLTRKIVTEILKGDIRVSSEYGKGSRFALRIPVRLP